MKIVCMSDFQMIWSECMFDLSNLVVDRPSRRTQQASSIYLHWLGFYSTKSFNFYGWLGLQLRGCFNL